jgi:hypothetical protein
MKRLIVLFGALLIAMPVIAQTNLSLPAGTPLKVKLETTLATFMTKTGEPFSSRVMEPVAVNGKTVIPVGATVQGHVTKVNEPRRVAGKPTIDLRPEMVVLPNGEKFTLSATLVDTSVRNGTDVNEEGEFKGTGHDRKDLMEVGAGTAGGMTVGGLVGGGKGVLVGGAIGATAAAVHWLSKRRSAILPAGTELTMELNRPMTLSAASGGK